jgi:Fic family protein
MFPEQKVGYAYIEQILNIPPMKQRKPSIINSNIGRIVNEKDAVLYPTKTAPADESILSHLFFALKNEPIDLYVLSIALKTVDKADISERINLAPTSYQSRIAGYLWEAFNQDSIDIDNSKASYIKLFDEQKFITGKSRKNPKWRVDFNGIGDLGWCPIVERTKEISAMMEKEILKGVKNLFEQSEPKLIERAMSWVYLSETEGSFAIEREKPSQDKAKVFAQLLSSIDYTKALTEEFLVEIQNVIVSNPLDQACFFRHQQNWLQQGYSGASSVTYVPPDPALACELMQSLMDCSSKDDEIDPIAKAAVISFGFVFIHPFMDGNGRLSRYLIHHALGQSNQLPDGMILPISVAMSENENEYLAALTDFSKPARKLCNVHYIDHENFSFQFSEFSESAFRYPNMTRQAEFMYRMADHALDINLKQEMTFLDSLDRTIEKINKQYDVRNNFLNELVVSAMKNEGIVSKNKRKKFAFAAKEEVFDAIEQAIKDTNNERTAQIVYGKIVESDRTGFTVKNKNNEEFSVPMIDHDFEIGNKVRVSIKKDLTVEVKKIIQLGLEINT